MVVGRLAAAERRLGMKEALGSRRARAVAAHRAAPG
jgi:hypothetical protein